MKFHLNALITFLILSSFSPCVTWANQISHLCKDANLKSFFTSEVDGFQNNHDYCLEKNPPKPITEVIKKILDQNTKISSFFKSSNKSFYKKPVVFFLEGKALAAIDSYAYPWLTGYLLRLGTFKTWNKNIFFDPAIYTHELGHLLPQIADPKLIPSSLRFHQRNPILFEGFSDFLAIAIHGRNVTPTKRFEDFILNFREVKLDDSYSHQGGFFRPEYTVRKLYTNCQDYISKNGNSQDTLSVCKKIESDTGGIFPPFDTSPINPSHWAGYDDHRLGVPFNSFLLNLGAKTSKDPYLMMMNAYSNPTGIIPAKKCGLMSSASTDDFIDVGFPTFSSVLAAIKKNLPTSDLKTFNNLSKYHYVETAKAISSIYEVDEKNILRFASDEIVHNMESELSDFFSKKNTCYDILTVGATPLPPDPCAITCL